MRRHFGAILVVVALVSMALGTAGFLAVDAGIGPATAFYRAVQLFYWNASFGAEVPWTLELARWLAPLVTLSALSRVAIALFQKRWDHFRARSLRGHVIVCGAGEKGSILEAELRGDGTPVVIIEQDEQRAESLAAEGALVLHGDASMPEVLRRAAAPHAAKIVAATGDDHTNLAIAMTASELGVHSIHAHSSDPSLCDLYQRHHALASSPAGAGSVRVYNRFRNIARCTLRDFPPESPGRQAHVVLPDLGNFGLAFAIELALVGQFIDDRRIHLHIVSPDASRELADFLHLYPGISHCADIDAIDLASKHLFPRRVASLVSGSTAAFTIFPSLEDESAAFSRGLELLESTAGHPCLRLLLPGSGDSPMRPLVERNPELHRRIGFLPSPARTCGREAVIAESLDRTACAIHRNWLAETQSQIANARARGDEALAVRHEVKATFKPWEELSEEQKGASRSQADHIPFKIRAAGLDPDTVTKADWEQLPDQQIERLARMEHARWAAYYHMTGWTFAAERNDALKRHPDLVPYDELDEPTKDYDRLAVRHIGQYI